MRRLVSPLWLTATLTLTCVAPATAAPQVHGYSCVPYIVQAERTYGIPNGLLHAIALTESGRDGEPYPWALNIAGLPYFPDDYRSATLMLRDSRGRPRQDVAIGCMQIHMRYHLDHFVQSEWALHPNHNVWYAAAFLVQLAKKYGSWPLAVAHYHGSDPTAQRQYLCMVSSKLARVAPQTGQTLGLANCAAVALPRVSATGARRQAQDMGEMRRRAALMSARQIGSIIVIPAGR